MKVKTTWIVIAAALLLTGGQFLAQQTKAQPLKDEIALRAAIEKETVQGDLKGAIELYKKLAQSKNRAVAANALVRMAGCYQTLGDNESRNIYERVLREYADQKDAVAIARAHVMGATPSLAANGDRAVWSGGYVDGYGTISPDGRFLTFVDWVKTGALMVHDLTTGSDRPLTGVGSFLAGSKSGAQYSVISKDGKQVAYEWWSDKPEELRIASLQGTGIPESRLLLRVSEEVSGINPMDWSSDGRWIAARLIRKDRTSQVALVSVPDGALRILKTSGWNDKNAKIFFSPDGRYIAYALLTDTGGSSIYVMAVDASRETTVVTHPSTNEVMGWSSDGKHLLFSSNRTGSWGLWVIPVADGKPQGEAMLARADIGSSWSLGLSASGTLYTWKNSSGTYIQVSQIDMDSGKLVGPSSGLSQRFIESRGRPEWSRDGKQLAYSSCGTLGGGPCSLFIQSLESSQVREVTQLAYFDFPSWSPDGNELLLTGNDNKAMAGVLKINTKTGDASAVFERTGNGAATMPQWSLDGKSFYYRVRTNTDAFVIRQRDVTSGSERELINLPIAMASGFSMSPDQKLIATTTNGETSSLLIIPVSGGQPRRLFERKEPDSLLGIRNLTWTSDGRAVVVATGSIENNRFELWQVPVDGRQPRKLDIDVSKWDFEGFRLSPDGKRIAFIGRAGDRTGGIWAFENFLPLSKPTK